MQCGCAPTISLQVSIVESRECIVAKAIIVLAATRMLAQLHS